MTIRLRTTWLIALTVAYFAIVAAVGFWRSPVDAPIDGTLAGWLFRLHRLGVPLWVNYGLIEFAANVVFFIPIGLLVALLLPLKRWYVAIAIGVLTSCTIELGQLLLLPARYASLGDIVANSLGAVLGTAAAVAGRLLVSRTLLRQRLGRIASRRDLSPVNPARSAARPRDRARSRARASKPRTR